MTSPFDPSARNVLVKVTVVGTVSAYEFKLALDTGANQTSLRPELLRQLGFDSARTTRFQLVRTGSGTVRAPVVVASHVRCLGQTRTSFPVAALDPAGAHGADGLLGLDFLRGLVLKLDFARGRVDLRPPAPRWQFWR